MMSSFGDELNRVTPFLDQMPMGVQFVDEELRYRYVNEVAAGHGKTDRDELLGRTMKDCYPGIEETEVYKRIVEVLRTGEPCRMENQFEFADGSEGWFELSIFQVAGGVGITSVDVTQRKRLGLHQLHGQRMDATRRLAGGIAHNFNNMLTVIGGSAEFVARGGSLSDQQRSDLDRIRAATERASGLTSNLLSLCRQEAVSPKRFQVAPSLRGMWRTLATALGQDITLQLNVERGLGSAEMDPTAFEQVVVSLALNARLAMGGVGTLRINGLPWTQTEDTNHVPLSPGEYALISVTDEGPGLEPALLEKVFDPFSVGNTRVGAGLGLSICWSTVENVGGTIQVESRLGVGTTFNVYLPRAATDGQATTPSGRPPPLLATRPLRVLVVDDEPVVRYIVVRQLESAGHTTVEARNGEDALAKLHSASQPYDLIVTDVLMPVMSGIELAKRVEAVRPPVPVLLMSGYLPEDAALEQARQWPLLSKPFTNDELLEQLELLAQRGRPEASAPATTQ